MKNSELLEIKESAYKILQYTDGTKRENDDAIDYACEIINQINNILEKEKINGLLYAQLHRK